MQSGDRVIAIDGRRQEGWADFFLDLRHKNPGDEMVFSIERGGQSFTLRTKVEAMAFGTGYIAIAVVSTPVLDPRGWAGIGVPMRFYRDISAAAWAICMMLFGIYFPQRWRFDRALPWVKWTIGAPMAAIALWEATTNAVASIDYPAAAPWLFAVPGADAVATAPAFIAPCFFFIGLSDKYGDSSLSPGDRRRIQLLYFGTTTAMTPLFF